MKTVLITGASGGLGRELANLFAARGHRLVLISRRRESLKEFLSRGDYVIEADLTKSGAPAQILVETQKLGLEVDILINNAGVGVYGKFIDGDFDKVRAMIDINMTSAMHLVQLFLPGMVARKKGHIVNVASIGAFFPGPLMAVYFATKAGMVSFTKALAFELQNQNIDVSVVCPGPFKSGFQRAAFGSDRNLRAEENLPLSREIAVEVFEGILHRKSMIIPDRRTRWIWMLARSVPQSWVMCSVHDFQKKIASSGLSRK